jgi:hypothetical protein
MSPTSYQTAPPRKSILIAALRTGQILALQCGTLLRFPLTNGKHCGNTTDRHESAELALSKFEMGSTGRMSCFAFNLRRLHRSDPFTSIRQHAKFRRGRESSRRCREE